MHAKAKSAGVRSSSGSAPLCSPNGPHSAGFVTLKNPTVGVPLAHARCITPQSALMQASAFAINAAEWIVYDALYAYCREMVRQGKPDGAFKG